MKDNFSSQSDNYAKYRPSYPTELYDYLNKIVSRKKKAWDCGTGNGQIGIQLAKSFETVYATDISQSQLNHALKANNIKYSVQAAEKTNFKNEAFDLIVVGQAIHWFDFDKFFDEVKRTASKGAILCVVGYARIRISPPIDELINHFYKNIIGEYWDPERKYIDENYETIPFPFDEIQTPEFEIKQQWNLQQFIGYLNTWSAVKHFIKKRNMNPINELETKIKIHWSQEENKEVTFPILLRIGIINDDAQELF